MSENIETVKKLYTAFGTGNLQGALDLMDGEIEWSVPGAAPWSGEGRGPAYVARFLETLGTTADLKVFEPRRFLSDGDTVAVIGYEEGEVRRTGRPWKAHFTHLFTIVGGKVTRHREYVDTQAIGEALRA
jgi:hypothetical protein